MNKDLKETPPAIIVEQLERALLDPINRRSPRILSELIADEFQEIGKSGNLYRKEDCLKPDLENRNITISDYKTIELSSNIIMAIYKSEENGEFCLRSSIYKCTEGKWKIIFHQGTSINPHQH